MKKYIFSILAVSALVIAACNKELPENEQVVSEEPGVEYEFTASIDENTPETSASIDFASTGKVTWVDTDKIAVWTVWDASTKGFVEFSVKSISEDRKTATFATTFTDTPTSFGNAYYPASIAGSSENSIVLPSIYTSVADAADGFPMMSSSAVTPGQPVTFKHLGSFLKLTLTGLPSGSSSLDVVASGASLAGTFTTALDNDNNPTLTVSSGTASVTVPVTSGDNTVYIPVPAGTYGFEIRVKNSTGRYLFRKEASSRTFYRAILKALKSLAYVAPSKYYVKTVSPSGYWDKTDVRLIQSESDKFEVWMNCDGNTTYYIYDEYNKDQVGLGCINTGLVKPATETPTSSTWSVRGELENYSWDAGAPMTKEGNWHYVRNIRFSKTWPAMKIVNNGSFDDAFNSGSSAGLNIYVAGYDVYATIGSGNNNLFVNIGEEGAPLDAEYDIFANTSSREVRVFPSSAHHDPSSIGGYYEFVLTPSTAAVSVTIKSGEMNEPFGNSGFPTDEFCISGTFNGWGTSSVFTYNGNMNWSLLGLQIASDDTYGFKLRRTSDWSYAAGVNSGLGSALYGTLKGDANDASVYLESGKYNVFVNTTENWYYLIMFEKQ